ncbi:Facilitated trehalose transporter Tret1 [Anthophora plagiata]
MENNDGESRESNLKLRIRQLLAALSSLLSVFIVGLSSGLDFVLLGQLYFPYATDKANWTSSNEHWISNKNEIIWLQASTVILTIPACWLSGFAMEKLGRRILLIIASIISLIGWLTIGFANNFPYLLIGNAICGLSSGLIVSVVPVYVGEISDPAFRAVLLSMMNTAWLLGTLTSIDIGALLRWRTTVYICATFSFINCLTCLFTRESPIWLIGKRQTSEAEDYWMYLRGRNALNEYRAIVRAHGEEKSSTVSWMRETLLSKHFLWPLAILCVSFFTYRFSGTEVVSFFIPPLIGRVFETRYVTAMRIQLIVSVFVCYLVFKCKRKTLLLISGFGSVSVIFLLSLLHPINPYRPWISTVCFIFYCIYEPLGLSSLPWILCGELFSRKLRGFGVGLATGFSFACFFVEKIMAPNIIIRMQPFGTLATYGIAIVLGTIFLWSTMPQTKDKTLLELERMFGRNSNATGVLDETDIQLVMRESRL